VCVRGVVEGGWNGWVLEEMEWGVGMGSAVDQAGPVRCAEPAWVDPPNIRPSNQSDWWVASQRH
jgi:hypothetical protein